MRVIEPGKPWSLTVECSGFGNGDGGCGAVLEIAEEDLIHTQSHCRDESTDYVTIECPECESWTDVSKPSIPERIFTRAIRKPARLQP